MSTIKTVANDGSVEDFINTIPDETKRRDSFELLELYKKVTKEEPKMWGASIIGFGSYHYKSERSKQEGDWPLIAFSPRKQNLTLYLMNGFDEYQELLGQLGKHTTSVSCLYIKRLADIDKEVLKKLMTLSFQKMRQQYKE